MNRTRALLTSFLVMMPVGVAVLAGTALPFPAAPGGDPGYPLAGAPAALAAGAIIALALAVLVRGIAQAAPRTGRRSR